MTVDTQAMLQRLSALEGVQGCALLDVDTGMTWLSESAPGQPAHQPLYEAATDYWRLSRRQRAWFEPTMGTLAAQVVIHAQGRLTLIGCGRNLVLATLSHEPDRVPWADWKQLATELRRLAASL